MPRKQTKHETQENIYKIYGLLLFSILSDFDLIVVFNALYIFFRALGPEGGQLDNIIRRPLR